MLLMVLFLFACKEECDDYTSSYNDNYLTAEQRSYIPLDKPEWDSIMYLKNGKDTITMYKKSVDSVSLYMPYNQYDPLNEPNYPNCNRVYQRYQNIKYTYRNDSTGDFMTVHLNLNNEFEVNGANRSFTDAIFINFNNYVIEFGSNFLINYSSKYYIGYFQQFEKIYENCFRVSYLNSTYVYNRNFMIINLESIDKTAEYKLLVP
jgi:hypothetical protein